MAGPVLLDYGTATKTISANLYNAVVVRDRHCRSGLKRNYLGSFRAVDLQRFSLARAQVVSLRPRPGCDRPAAWADVHHVVHAEDGGPTCASNCVLLCRRHHSRLHRKGWSAELKPDGELVVHNPDGRVFTSHPPGSRPRPPPALFAA